MSTKPILFNTDMVRSLLGNRKTVTRRVVKPPVTNTIVTPPLRLMDKPRYFAFYGEGGVRRAPYSPGDILYVRENWQYMGCVSTDSRIADRYVYRADWNGSEQPLAWRSSANMPREAARIFLRVTDMRVERLRDITVDGILREGVDVEIPPICKQSIDQNFPTDEQRAAWDKMTEKQREEYVQNRARHTYIGWCDYADRLFLRLKSVWDSTIKPADRSRYGWEANPWVWVIKFERISKKALQQ